MARCQGITRSGDQCKLEAREGSRFCHLHDPVPGEDGDEPAAASDETSAGDLLPLILAGAAAAGLLLFLRAFGRWIPR